MDFDKLFEFCKCKREKEKKKIKKNEKMCINIIKKKKKAFYYQMTHITYLCQ